MGLTFNHIVAREYKPLSDHKINEVKWVLKYVIPFGREDRLITKKKIVEVFDSEEELTKRFYELDKKYGDSFTGSWDQAKLINVPRWVFLGDLK